MTVLAFGRVLLTLLQNGKFSAVVTNLLKRRIYAFGQAEKQADLTILIQANNRLPNTVKMRLLVVKK